MKPATLTGAVGAATENVGRGISYSAERPAVFGRVIYRAGPAEIAGSAITVAGSADVELALTARWVLRWRETEFRGSIERAMYPGADPNIDYWEIGLTASRAGSWGTVDVGMRSSPDDAGGAQYSFVDGSRVVRQHRSGTWALRGRLAWRPYDDPRQADYRHWSVGVEYSHYNWLLEVTFHETDLQMSGFFASDARIVARVTCRFGRS
jgi:hypothetical protein